ncbi:two-component system signal transduction response regulator [Gottschalkia acidurici 9a]|uniref:Two-component system signal transduction response regulator n=1 Tax=Gottschalkia acidurici (strain ATCC 7906 / DSM 604 / BCRC 14475 / CIP 104303 / KCTC 5404 / NCIMB 10678 / 9a) TaxID=1128398 RepID=K0B390_GOTA9|nr:response regulator [Gottschalkia acidurici]AFS79106.1 two-component system signal transduction response regulator [Gottschalkia acidurici 9a]
MKVLLVDDEELGLEVLEILISQIDGMEVVGKFTDPNRALKELSSMKVDALFLDIEMGELSGIGLVNEIKKNNYDMDIVFVTAYPQYAIKAFEVNAIDYLLKPVKIERLRKSILRLKEHRQKRNTNSLNEKESSQLVISTMGKLQVLDYKCIPIKWRTQKVRELFAFLVQHKKQPIHKMKIVEELWYDVPIDKATTLLHTTIYQLRKTIREKISVNLNPIVLENNHYRLNIDVQIDLIELENILEDSKVNKENVKKILELYRGDYLEEEDYSWCLYKQQELRRKTLQYLEKYLVELTSKNKSLLVENCLIKMLELSPYDEEYAYLLIKYYGEINNKIKMIEMYEIFRRRLNKELGIDVQEKILKAYSRYINI